MASESSSDSLKMTSCKCGCGGGCVVVADERSGNWLPSMKLKHEKERQLLDIDHDGSGIVRVEIEDECLALREAVSSQQKSIQTLYIELEEERNAASSAANETMSMILRLQTEKAELEMEARQFKRFVEERSLHDQQELLALEDLLYKREQMIQSLTCEVQAYKYKLLSYGLTESEVEGEHEDEFPPYEYPPLKCKVMRTVGDDDDDDVVDVEKYVFGETPKDRLKSLENRISQMERTPTYSQIDGGGDFTSKNVLEKVIVGGQSPIKNIHSKKFSCDSSLFGPEFMLDSPNKLNTITNLRKMDNVSEAGDYITDRVCTVDSEFKGGFGVYDEDVLNTPKDFGNQCGEFEDPYVKKLCMRLQALEADRESMRQAIIAMRTDKAQLVLLREIAQHLCKEMTEQKKTTTTTTRSPIVGGLSFFMVFKWITSIVLWRKNGRQVKYMFGSPSNSVGLLMLLDKRPNGRSWRYLSRTQLRD